MSLYTPNNNKPLFLFISLVLLTILLLIIPLRPTQWNKDEGQPPTDSVTVVMDTLVDSVVERTIVAQDTQTVIVPATDSTVADTLVQIDTVTYQETLAIIPVPITTKEDTNIASTPPVIPTDNPTETPTTAPETVVSGAFFFNLLMGLLVLIGLGILVFRIISKRWEKQYWLQYNAKLAPIKRAEKLPTLEIDFDTFQEEQQPITNESNTAPKHSEDTDKKVDEPKEKITKKAPQKTPAEPIPAPAPIEQEPSTTVKILKEVSTRPLRIVWAIAKGIKSIFSFFSEDSAQKPEPTGFKWQDAVSFVLLGFSYLCYNVILPYHGEHSIWYGLGFMTLWALPALLRLHWIGGVVGILLILFEFIGLMIYLILKVLEGAEPSTDDTPWMLYIGTTLTIIFLIVAARRGWLTLSSLKRLVFWSIIGSSSAFLFLPYWVHWFPVLEDYIYASYYGIYEFHYFALDLDEFGLFMRGFILFVLWRIAAGILGNKEQPTKSSTNNLTNNNIAPTTTDQDNQSSESDAPIFSPEALEKLFNTPNWWKKTPLQHLDIIDMSNKGLNETSEFITLYLPDCINVQELYLGLNEFKAFPFEITELESLKVLDLASNQLKAIIPDIGFLKTLEHLNLSDNQLTALPREIAQLSNLLVLNLRGNPLTQEALDELSFLLPNTEIIFEEPEEELIERLKVLLEEELKAPETVERIWSKLNGQQLRRLPAQLFQLFSNLRSISLHQNNFTEIPEVLTRLSHLSELDLSHNPITTIPTAINKIEQLKFLDISGTSIEKVETNMKNLKTLVYEQANISQVPDFVSKLYKLEGLSLYDNQISAIPASFRALKDLNYINLGNNPLQSSVLILAILPELRSLQLSNVGWGDQKTPIDLKKLQQIKRLNLSRNKYNKLPKEVLALNQLEALSLSDNNLQKLSGNIHALSQLCYLELANNNLKQLPKNIQQLKQLRVLDLSGNPILPKHYQELKAWLPYTEILVDEEVKVIDEDNQEEIIDNIEEILEEADNSEEPQEEEVDTPEEDPDLVKQVKALLGDKMKHPESVTYIGEFFYVDLPDLPLSIMKQFTKLHTLYCCNTPFKKIPEALYHLPSLKAITLNQVQLTRIPDEIAQFKNLERLEIPENSITYYSPKLKELPNLKELNIDSNGLTELPSIIFELSNLQTLSISSNHLLRIPDKITNLKKLKSLDMSFTGLSVVPDSIFELTQLQKLRLNGNKMQTLPKGLSKLKNLNKLSIGYNNDLQSSFAMLNELPALRQLNIGGMTLSPKRLEQIAELTNLEELWLSNSKVTSMPSSMKKLSNLRLLSLTDTGLSQYPEVISQLKNLNTLYLEKNNLSTLPSSIKQLKKLRRLDLSDNNFSIQEKRKIQRMLSNVEIKF